VNYWKSKLGLFYCFLAFFGLFFWRMSMVSAAGSLKVAADGFGLRVLGGASEKAPVSE